MQLAPFPQAGFEAKAIHKKYVTVPRSEKQNQYSPRTRMAVDYFPKMTICLFDARNILDQYRLSLTTDWNRADALKGCGRTYWRRDSWYLVV